MNLKILDTGYVSRVSPVSSQTQLSDANRAGYTGSAVSAFTLNSSVVSLQTKSATEDNPVINTITDSPTGFVSASNHVYKVSCILAKTIVTSGWSTNNVYQFFRLERTRGLKILYPSTVTDTDKNIVEALGAINTNVTTATTGFAHASPTEDNGTVSTTTPYLVGRVKNMTCSDDATQKSFWKITFDFEVSG